MPLPLPLTGRVALVTGGGRRVGQAIALELARAGSDLVVHYGGSASGAADTVRLARGHGVRAEAVSADLADPEAIRHLFDFVRSGFGRLDVLVNSAARFERVPLAALTAEAWDRMHAVNLRAPFLCAQGAVALMGEAGHIINIVDIGGGSIAWPNYAHYLSAKAGLAMLTRSLALELAPKIRVNGVSPGTVLWAEDQTDEEKRLVTSRIPLGRIGVPGDIARTVAFLAHGPDFITGQIIAVDGGRSVSAGGV